MKEQGCTRCWKKWQKILVVELVGRLKSSWVAESGQHPWKRCWPSSWEQGWKHLSHRLLWTLRRVQSETRRAKRKSPQVRWPFLKRNSLLQSYSSKNLGCSLYQTNPQSLHITTSKVEEMPERDPKVLGRTEGFRSSKLWRASDLAFGVVVGWAWLDCVWGGMNQSCISPIWLKSYIYIS